MTNKSLVTMLAVAAISLSAVNSFAAEAGVLGLKPSTNQGATQSSGNTNTANTEVQQYDTTKYQFPAQQLKAEGKNFDKYDWKLFQRFDTHELMYNEWAAAMNFNAAEYSANSFRKNEDGTTTYFFDFRESGLKYDEIERIGSSGKKFYGSGNELRFRRNDEINTYIPISLRVKVYTKPENCFPFSMQITIPGSHDHAWNIIPLGFYQETFWANVLNGSLTPEESALYDANYGKAVDPVKLYYPSRSIYVSGWCLNDLAQKIRLINSCFKDENPENCSAYVYSVHKMLQSMSSIKKLNQTHLDPKPPKYLGGFYLDKIIILMLIYRYEGKEISWD